MGDRCERIANRLNAAITAAEGREAALRAKVTRGETRKADLREAEVCRRQAAMMRAKGKK